MAPFVKDYAALLAGIPAGMWVALSHDTEQVVAAAVEMRDAVIKANQAGEAEPVILRVPSTTATLIL